MPHNAHSSNFNPCPSSARHHSTKSTDAGTSAKIQCRVEAGKLMVDEACSQEGVLGIRYAGPSCWIKCERGEVQPMIASTKPINAEVTLLLNKSDSPGQGIRPASQPHFKLQP